MLQTLNPYTSTAKTAQIMARYRPIAPRPNVGGGCEAEGSGSGSGGSSSSPTAMSPTISQSPYLRNVWPHLQSRPTRTRKRGRTSLGPPPPAAFKRPRTLLQGLAPSPATARNLSIQGFAPIPNFPTTHHTLVTLPLLPCSSPHHHHRMQPNVIDLNTAAEIPEEKDLLAQLQKPTANVISPRAIRLIPSTVSIKTIKYNTASPSSLLKNAEEVERELESEVLPAFVSDSNHKVRLVNSAYKAMVGQPECPWLESIMTTSGAGGDNACKSICGEVVLNFTDSDPISSSDGFSCWARIELGKNGVVNAFGEAMRLACESKDYTFAWRFQLHATEAASEAGSDVKQQYR
ncbi:hypothetical protein LXL04_039146 [Taraxacum kok-saghyz]